MTIGDASLGVVAGDRVRATGADPAPREPLRTVAPDRRAVDARLSAASQLAATAFSLVYPGAAGDGESDRLTAADLGVAALFISPTGERLPTRSLLQKLNGTLTVTTTIPGPQGAAIELATAVVEEGENTRNLVRLVQGVRPPPPQAGATAYGRGLVLGVGFSV